MKLTGDVEHMSEKCIKILVGKPEGKSPLGGPRHRWEDNFKMDLEETVERCGLDSSHSG
jgi:hypothetical protein